MAPTTPPYVEPSPAIQPTRSWTGSRCRRSWRKGAGGAFRHVALGLTDHNSVSGSMELAQAAGDHGVRAIHGAEIDLTTASGCGARGRHITLLVGTSAAGATSAESSRSRMRTPAMGSIAASSPIRPLICRRFSTTPRGSSV